MPHYFIMIKFVEVKSIRLIIELHIYEFIVFRIKVSQNSSTEIENHKLARIDMNSVLRFG